MRLVCQMRQQIRRSESEGIRSDLIWRRAACAEPANLWTLVSCLVPIFCWRRADFSGGTHDVTRPQQDVQQSCTVQIIENHFAQADVQSLARALIRDTQLLGGTRRGEIGLQALIDGVQELIRLAAEMFQTKRFVPKGSNHRARASGTEAWC